LHPVVQIGPLIPVIDAFDFHVDLLQRFSTLVADDNEDPKLMAYDHSNNVKGN